MPRTRPQVRQEGLCHVQRAEDVCVEGVEVLLGRRLLDGADERVPRCVDEVRDVPVLGGCVLCDLFDLGEGRGHVQGDDVRALLAEGSELGDGAAAGDDVVAAREGGEGHVVAEAGAGACDEPDGWLGGHVEGWWSGVVNGRGDGEER